jgi:FlgD Ig-like domain/Beta-propeller repeat
MTRTSLPQFMEAPMKRFGSPLLVSMALMLAAVGADAVTPAHFWSKRFGGAAGNDIARAVAVDVSGNVYITGSFTGTVDFGGGGLTSSGGPDIFLAKYSSSGNYISAARFGSTGVETGTGVAIDASGNVYLTGFFAGTVSFGASPLTAVGSSDIFLAKYDPTGIPMWTKSFGGNLTETGNSLALDGSGNVIITGQLSSVSMTFGGGSVGTNGSTDIFLAKFNTSGTHQWSKNIGGVGADLGASVTSDAAGNVFVTGYFANSTDFGGGALNSAGGSDIFVAKYNSLGIHLWSKRLGSTLDDQGLAVAVNAAGAAYVLSAFQGTVDFGGGALISAGGNDVSLARYDASGVHQWSKRFGGTGNDFGYGMALDGAGQPVITGDYSAGADFGSGPFTSAGSDEIFLAKYTASGAPVWSGHFGSALDDIGYGVAVDGSSNVYLTGYFNNSVDFGGGALTSAGSLDICLAKYSASAAQPAITSIQDIKNDQGREVKIRFGRSGFDDALAPVPVTSYEAYRRDDAAPALVATPDGLATLSTSQLLAAGWTFAGSAPAHGESSYGIDAPTIGDSTITLGQYYSVFYVRAATATTTRFYDSPVDSGYSVDNLAPGVPQNFVFTAGELSWNESTAKDFDYFTVYGYDKDLFGAATVVDYSVSPSMKVVASPYVYYYVTATDFSGNESKPAKVNALSGVGGTPKSYVLSVSNYPNPFNPRTTVSYTVPSRGAVSIAIYDANGARVATILDHAERAAGAYSIEWDGRADSGATVGSGVYFARIEHASGTRSKKMVLLK